jgi:hypothetical protein
LKDLHEITGLSVSYLSEIERGVKQLSFDRLADLAQKLRMRPDELIDGVVEAQLKARLSQLGVHLELSLTDLGIPEHLLASLLEAHEKDLLTLLRTLQTLVTSMGLQEDDVLDEWLRARLAVDEAYWPDMERRASEFLHRSGLFRREPARRRSLAEVRGCLERYLRAHYGIGIEPLARITPPGRKEPLHCRFDARQRTLFVYPDLDESHKAFVVAREIAYHHLGHEERSYIYRRVVARSVRQARADYDSSYFAACLLMPQHIYVEGLKSLFRQVTPAHALEALRAMLFLPQTISAEVLWYRLTQLLQVYFRLSPHFITMEDRSTKDRVDYHIGARIFPVHGFIVDANQAERHCRRWQTIALLEYEQRRLEDVLETDRGVLRLQRSTFVTRGQTLLNLSVLIRTSEGRKKVLTIGLPENKSLRELCSFSQHLRPEPVGESCETCPLYDRDPDSPTGVCELRVPGVANLGRRHHRQALLTWQQRIEEGEDPRG